MDRRLALSVLDQAPVPAGSAPGRALRESVELARAAEAWGYRRYWIAEHHNTPSLAATAPEVVVAAVAAATSSIRVGSGGVLLPYYSPLKVAEVFRSLHALFPGRIDLGIGRAAGTDPAGEAALLASGGASGDEHFAENLAELLAFLEVGAATEAEVRAMPEGPGGPEVWLLGSSSYSSACAAYLGLPLAFAHFITPAHGPQIVESYRRGFRGGPGQAPRVVIAVAALCADSDEEAERHAATADLWRLGPEGARRPPILPPEEVGAHEWSALQRAPP
ncbi:MAG TPA: MsnO8 family LLM class oxidoreductase, partial [Acidimicrobiales bacterium]|nr:MsnO8 family LLM class oxidoreductase [Acidimicrobiales bacterium]